MSGSRYCGMCDTSTSKTECPACGAETERWPAFVCATCGKRVQGRAEQRAEDGADICGGCATWNRATMSIFSK